MFRYCLYSLRRFEKEEDGLRLFEQFREKIFVLVRATDSFPGRDLMGKWMHSAVKHPSWTIAHLAAVHNQLDVLKHQLVARYMILQKYTPNCQLLLVTKG